MSDAIVKGLKSQKTHIKMGEIGNLYAEVKTTDEVVIHGVSVATGRKMSISMIMDEGNNDIVFRKCG